MLIKDIFSKPHGIRGKLVITLIIAALIPLSVAGVYGVYFSTKALENTILGNFEYELSSKSGDIEKFLKTMHTDVLFLSRTSEMRELADSEAPVPSNEFRRLRERAAQIAGIISRARPYYYQVRYIDEKGYEIVRVDSDGEKTIDIQPDKLQYKGDRYYFIDSITYPEGECYVSPMDLNVEWGKVEIPHKPVLRVATPVFNSSGNKRGVIIINLYASHLIRQIQRLNIAKGGTTFLVNKDGFYLSHFNNLELNDVSFNLVSAESIGKYYSADLTQSILSGHTGTVKGPEEVISYSPIFTGDNISKEYWILGIVYPKQAIFSTLFNLKAVYIIIGFVTVIAASVSGILIAKRVTKPILDLHQGVKSIAGGNLEQHLEIKTGDEIEGLSRSFNNMVEELRLSREKMLNWNEELRKEVEIRTRELEKLIEERIAMERQLLHADKLASIGELSAGIAHEIGNPLAAIKTVIQAMDDVAPFDDKQRDYIDRILKEVDRLTLFLRTFSSFAHPVVSPTARCRIGQVLGDVIFLVRNEAEKHKIRLLPDDVKDLPDVSIGADHLKQVFINLCVNAIQAMPKGGELRITSRLIDRGMDRSASELVMISVSDTGAGIPSEITDKIFDPFFTTKTGGSGLGLSIVQRLVREYHGDIRVKSHIGKGAIFEVLLPAFQPQKVVSHE